MTLDTEGRREVQCSYGCKARAPSDGQKVPVGWGRTGMVGEFRWACPDHLDEMRRDCGLDPRRPTDG